MRDGRRNFAGLNKQRAQAKEPVVIQPAERERPFVEADMDMREREARLERTRGGSDFIRRIRSY